MVNFDDRQSQREDNFISIVKYLNELAKSSKSSIEATIFYLLDTGVFSTTDLYIKLKNIIYKNNTMGFFDIETPNQVLMAISEKLPKSPNNNYEIPDSCAIDNLYKNYFIAKSDLPIYALLDAAKPTTKDDLKPNNTLASFITSYNLPQVTALILGISFEHIEVTSGRAYINENDFPYEWAVKFDKLLASLVAMAKQGQIKGLSIAYYEPFTYQTPFDDKPPSPKKNEYDYLNSVIDRASLEEYLNSLGYDLKSLIEKQNPLNTPSQPTDNQLLEQVADQQATIDQQAKEIAELKAQLASIEQASNDTQSNDKLLSNVELNNLKKTVIAENNRQIATILKSMDIRGELSKDDLLQVIRPNMESMAKVLNGENSYKALLVVDNTIKDNHLKSLSFQTGRKTKEQTEKKSIQLIFDREKPPITEN